MKNGETPGARWNKTALPPGKTNASSNAIRVSSFGHFGSAAVCGATSREADSGKPSLSTIRAISCCSTFSASSDGFSSDQHPPATLHLLEGQIAPPVPLKQLRAGKTQNDPVV